MTNSFDMILLAFIIIAGFYMAWNIGANDVANAIGTSVGSGALTLKQAVILAAVLEFCGAFFFGSHVTETIQSVIDPNLFSANPKLLVWATLSALLAASLWMHLASYYGWPVSTTHSIIGALVGVGVISAGIDAISWKNIAYIGTSWVLSPIFSGILSYTVFQLLRKRLFYTFHPVEEAKKIAPLLAFFLVTALSLVTLSKGLSNKGIVLTSFQSIIISFTLGIISMLILHFKIRHLKATSLKPKSQPYGSEIATGLEKATKHLQRVKTASIGEMQYHVTLLHDEVSGLSQTVQQNIQEEVSHTEYRTVEKIFGYLQFFSAALMAFGHGANDVANAIGPLATAIGIITTGQITGHSEIPAWLLALGGIGIIFGVTTWGWRVIQTIGNKITELTPTRGFAAEFGAALTILFASRIGMPIFHHSYSRWICNRCRFGPWINRP